MSDPGQPQGLNITAIGIDDSGAFTSEYEDGSVGVPTVSIERAVLYRHRARAIAFHEFLRGE